MLPRSRILIAGLLLALPVAGAAPVAAQPKPLDGGQEAASKAAYTVRIKGVPETELRSLLRRLSRLVSLRDSPPPSVAGIRRRARDDLARLRRVLRSRGFYAAEIAYEIAGDDQPFTVMLRVSTGPVYLLGGVDIVYTKPPSDRVQLPRTGRDLGLRLGQRAASAAIIEAQGKLLTRLENNGHPNAEVVTRDAVVNHDKRTLSVTWRVNPGQFLVFNGWKLRGLTTVEREYLRRFRKWQPGEPFDQRRVDATRKALMRTNLFASVTVARGKPAQNRMPLIFTFEERDRRSIGFTGSASTEEGPRIRGFWEHRNIFGRDENLRLSAGGGLLEQVASAEVTIPNYRRLEQNLAVKSTLRRQDTEAFEQQSFSGSATLDRPLDGAWRLSLGAEGEFTETTDAQGTRQFFIASGPAAVSRDTRENVLNPIHGSRIRLKAEPVVTAIDETQIFLRTGALATAYRAPLDGDRLVLAGRARFGTIVAGATDNIPASKRYYAGGAGSVRGFGFQDVGPIADDGDPQGGRSILEFSGEIRAKVTDTIGIVPFIDAGQVYDSPIPNITRDPNRVLRYGAGLGVRYFTPVGPVRVDVAFPLNNRPRDDRFELYIGLGQAF